MTRRGKKLVCGAGINDSPTPTSRKVNGKMVHDPAYKDWHNMLNRCYSGKYPEYSDVLVHPDWHTFSVFHAWWCKNYKEGYVLDKDLINPSARLYSEENCTYIPSWMNVIIKPNRKHLRGVTFDKNSGRYKTQGEIKPYYGYFDTELEAHFKWWEEEGYIEKERILSVDISLFNALLEWCKKSKSDIYHPDIIADILISNSK